MKAHSYINISERGRYEVGKRRVRMTKFSVSLAVCESRRNWSGVLVFSDYVLAPYSLYT